MSTNVQDFSSREALLSANSALITQLQDRLKAKRFRPQEGDNVRIGYMRALIQALQCQNAILKDAELDELKKEIEELKDLMKCKSRE
jgi:molybdopterin converting factor small subunit